MNHRKQLGFYLFVALGLISAAFVWFGLPHDREVKSLWIFLTKLLPFLFAAEAVARLDPDWAKRKRLPLLLIPPAFLAYFVYFVPKIFFYGAEVDGTKEAFDSLYYNVLTLTPLIILSLVLAYRLGGGSAATVRRLSYGMLLLMLSGLEDLAFLTVNHHTDPAYQHIPAVWTWASHMTVFIGHAPTKHEAYAFITFHVLLALTVFFSPQRWWDSLGGRLRAVVRRAEKPQPVEAERSRSAQPESV